MGKRLKASSRNKSFAPLRIPFRGLNTKHDESGQVYNEVSCQGSSMIADWKWKVIGSTREFRKFSSQGLGCSSLYDMSMRSCLVNSSDITSETLEEIPEGIGLALWKRIITAQLDSVQLFIEFSQRYSSAIGRKFRLISIPNLPLLSYYKDISPPNHQWLTYLTLLNVTIERTTLIQVSLVTNLVALTVGPDVLAPDIGVDDSLIRTWSRSASMGAFCSLRVLVLRGQKHVTPRAFEYLTFFPALAIFTTDTVRGSGMMDKNIASSFGWKHRTNKKTDEWRNMGSEGNRTGWDELFHALFTLGEAIDAESPSSEDFRKLDMLPVIHLAIGGFGDLARSGEGPMHIWNRMSKIDRSLSEDNEKSELPDWSTSNQNCQSQDFSGPSTTDLVRKRAHESGEIHAVKRAVKPALRTSKAHNIGDLLSEFLH